MKRSLSLTLLLTGLSLFSVRPLHALSPALLMQTGEVRVITSSDSEEDSLAEPGNRAIGISVGGIPGGGSTGLPGSKYLFGAFARHIFPGDLFGEVRASIGVVNDGGREVRLIPMEYRLSVRLVPVLTAGREGGEGFSPFVYMGTGILFHKTIEASPEPDPRTGRLNGRLPASAFFSLEDGITPLFSLGLGFDIRLTREMNLQVNLGGTKTLNEIALRGGGYGSDFLDFSVGVHVRLPERRRSGPPPLEPPALPPVQEEQPEQQVVKREAEADSTAPSAGVSAPLPVDTLMQAECRFAVQAGGYQSYENALEALDRLAGFTEGHPELYRDARRNLYAVRTSPEGSFRRALARSRELREENLFPGAVLYRRCGGAEPPPLRFQVQVAAIGDSLRALNHARALEARYGTGFRVERSGEGGVFRVRTQPYPTLGRAREVRDELRAMGMGDALFPAPVRPERTYRPRYSYFLQIARYDGMEQAGAAFRALQPQQDLPLRLQYYRGGEESVVLGYPGSEWDALLEVQQRLESARPDLETELYLIEESEES